MKDQNLSLPQRIFVNTAAVIFCLAVAAVAILLVSRASDKFEYDAAELAHCKKIAVTPQEYAECK